MKFRSNVTITCIANCGLDLNLSPYWYIIKNGAKQLCQPPEYSLQKPQYHSILCTWTNNLNISHLTSEEIFYCGSDYLWANHTVRLQGRYDYKVGSKCLIASIYH